MLIFWVLLTFRIINVSLIIPVTRKRLTYHAAITDGIALVLIVLKHLLLVHPSQYGVINTVADVVRTCLGITLD